MKLDPDVINYISMANFSGTDPLIGRAATLFIFGGALIFFIGFLGCCGALKGHQAALFVVRIYIIILLFTKSELQWPKLTKHVCLTGFTSASYKFTGKGS